MFLAYRSQKWYDFDDMNFVNVGIWNRDLKSRNRNGKKDIR